MAEPCSQRMGRGSLPGTPVALLSRTGVLLGLSRGGVWKKWGRQGSPMLPHEPSPISLEDVKVEMGKPREGSPSREGEAEEQVLYMVLASLSLN